MFWISALALGVSATVSVVNTGGNGASVSTSQHNASLDNNTYKSSISNTLDHNDSYENPVISHASSFLNTLVGFYCQSTVINQSFQNLYYQLGCVCFLLAFLAPIHRPYGALWSRCMLIFGCVLFTIWAQCMPDALIWSICFFLVNFIYMIVLLCKLRPVSFDKEIEAVSFF
jgi:hypothetical protein